MTLDIGLNAGGRNSGGLNSGATEKKNIASKADKVDKSGPTGPTGMIDDEAEQVGAFDLLLKVSVGKAKPSHPANGREKEQQNTPDEVVENVDVISHSPLFYMPHSVFSLPEVPQFHQDMQVDAESLKASLKGQQDVGIPLELDEPKISVSAHATKEQQTVRFAVSPDRVKLPTEIASMDDGEKPASVEREAVARLMTERQGERAEPAREAAREASGQVTPKAEAPVAATSQQAAVIRNPVAAETRSIFASQELYPKPVDLEIISQQTTGSVKSLHLRLDPLELGMVTAHIRLVGERVQIHLIADKPQTALALAADRDLLEKALRFAGFGDDASIDVSVQERGSSLAASSSGLQQPSQQAQNMQDQNGGRNSAQAQAEAQGQGQGDEYGRHGQSGRDGESGKDGQRPRNGASGLVEQGAGDTGPIRAASLSRGIIV